MLWWRRRAGPFLASPVLCGLHGRTEGLEVYLLVEGATPETEVEALVVSVFNRFHHLFGHPHSKGEVAAHLPHHNGSANILGLDLNVLAGHLLSDLQAVGAMLVAPVLGAIGKGRWEFIRFGLVDFLLYAFLEALENYGDGTMECLDTISPPL
uniref:Uncharacterized protein n=1 Tax=Podarcis muralis TaxID=64176 RepID=A0A670J7H9_PODMU